MRFSSAAVARAIGASVEPHLPPSIVADFEPQQVVIRSDGVWWAGFWITDDEEFADESELANRVEHVLSSLQDTIVDLTYQAWPAQIPELGLPMPWARIEGDRLRLGFGEVLELEPIELSNVVATGPET